MKVQFTPSARTQFLSGMGRSFQKNQNLDANLARLGTARTMPPQSYPFLDYYLSFTCLLL